MNMNPQTTASLLQKKDFYESVLTGLHALVYIYDIRQQKIIWKNKEPRDFLWDVEDIDLEGYTISDFTKVAVQQHKKIVAGTTTIQESYTLQKTDKSKILHVCEAIFPFEEDENGQVIKIVGISAEITKQIDSLMGLNRLVRENKQMRHQLQLGELTEKELDILRLLAQGKTTKEISIELERSINTIKTHRARIMSKLGAETVVDLIHFATQVGIH